MHVEGYMVKLMLPRFPARRRHLCPTWPNTLGRKLRIKLWLSGTLLSCRSFSIPDVLHTSTHGPTTSITGDKTTVASACWGRSPGAASQPPRTGRGEESCLCALALHFPVFRDLSRKLKCHQQTKLTINQRFCV